MNDLILYTTEDGRSQIKLRAQEKTVWLTQLEMAELFDATEQSISLHLKNVFGDGELAPAGAVKESLTVQTEDKSSVSGHASVDQFRDSTKMVGPGKNRRRNHDGR
jgi:hypothetical protein